MLEGCHSAAPCPHLVWAAVSPSCPQARQLLVYKPTWPFLLPSTHCRGTAHFSCPFIATSLWSSPGQEDVVVGSRVWGPFRRGGVFPGWLLAVMRNNTVTTATLQDRWGESWLALLWGTEGWLLSPRVVESTIWCRGVLSCQGIDWI